MFFFGKKKKKKEDGEEEGSSDDLGETGDEPEVPVAAAQEAQPTGDVSIGKITADVEKLKAQFGTFYELQKASNERFSNITEQLGGLRTMLIERDKDSQRLEAKATQAIDMVKSVQPDKFMVDLRKMDSKIEALKANLEGNENVMKNTVNELKDMRNKMNVFKGMEQVVNLNEEVKKELMSIKKIQATVERHADKVETMFSEMQKRLSDFIKFNDMVKDLDKSFKNISSDFDSIKVKISSLGSKKEVENLMSKFEDFEKYVSNIVSLINKKFQKLEGDFTKDFKGKFEETDKLLTGFRMLAEKTPDLDKYFNLLSEEAKKAPKKEEEGKVENIKELGAEEKVEVEKKESVLSKVGGAVAGAASNIKDKMKKKE